MIVSIGANGLAKQIYSLIEEHSELIFIDTTISKKTQFNGHPVYPDMVVIEDEIKRGNPVAFFVSIGNPIHRINFYNQLKKIGAYPADIIAESACISSNVKIGEGNIILGFSLIEWDVKLGDGNLINVGAYLHHDSSIGNFNEIMPGAKILGGVKIGNLCRIGTNASILPNISICDNVVVGAGAVVTRDIIDPGTYVGIPAKKR